MTNAVSPTSQAADGTDGAAASSPLKPALLGLDRGALAAELGSLVDRPFRVDQIYRALHLRGARRFDEMTDLSLELRARLAQRYRVGWPEVARRVEADDGTVKFLLRLADGATIEAVDIPDGERRTLCLSSQAGCALGCTFCVTGYWGAGRDLTAGEIVGQVLVLARERLAAGEGINLVLMGMGEPLQNLDAVKGALDILCEQISWRRITVSTVGWLPGIEAMARWEKRPNLAVSLHAPDDERRSQIMPINRTYPLAELFSALRRFPLERGRKLTFEYLLIRDFNDRPADADATARLLRGLSAKVNLIPMNPDPVLASHLEPPDDATIEAFRDRLRRAGLVATVRRRRGDDVSAACGQLRAFGRAAHGAPARRGGSSSRGAGRPPRSTE